MDNLGHLNIKIKKLFTAIKIWCLMLNKGLYEQFTILKKGPEKFEFLVHEVLYMQDKKTKLDTQSDSIKAKPFSN